jgi:hypothetical protein
MAMVGKIEAAINPDVVFSNGLVLLRVNGPLSWLRDPFAL